MAVIRWVGSTDTVVTNWVKYRLILLFAVTNKKFLGFYKRLKSVDSKHTQDI